MEGAAVRGGRTSVTGAAKPDEGKHLGESFGGGAAQQGARPDVPMHEVVHVHRSEMGRHLGDCLHDARRMSRAGHETTK